MNIEVLILGVLIGITLLAYMIAINAHGPVRLGLSYLIATAILAGTVWAIVQHVNAQFSNSQVEEVRRLEQAKQEAELKVLSQESALIANKGRFAIAARLNTLITTGSGLALSVTNASLQDGSVDLEGLIARSLETSRKIGEFRQEVDKFQAPDTMFSEGIAVIKAASQSLVESAYYFRTYYHSEDSDQEQTRERVMRQKARDATSKFQKAAALIAGAP